MTNGSGRRFVVSALVAVAMSVVGCGGQEVSDQDEPFMHEGEVTALDVCSNTTNLSHCETVTCSSAQLYRNYNPNTDNFSDPFNTVTYGMVLNVHNAPDRRFGPRGVRIYNSGIWGFVSGNCVSGGL
jgi:hypothetical protein